MIWAIERRLEPGVPIPDSVGRPRWYLWLVARMMSGTEGYKYRLIRVSR